MIRVSRCPCGSSSCRDWHVDGYAAVMGVKFSEMEARAVAHLLTEPDVVRRYAALHAGAEAMTEVVRLRQQLVHASESIADLMTPQTASNVLESHLALSGDEHDREMLRAFRKYAEAKGWD